MSITVIVRVDLYYKGETLKSLGKVKLRMRSIVSLVVLLCCISALLPYASSESFPTYILSENLEQEVTSSALNWVSADRNFKNYDEAVIGAYPSDSSDDNTIKKPVYVCRARLTGSWLAGHLRPSDKKCVVSLYGQVHHTSDYQILINTENTARLSWVLKTKLTSITQGTVLGGQETNKNFVGRTRAKDSIWTHILGYMDPTKNFGTYIFVDDKSEQVESEDGELLVEAEPKSYEYRNIKYGTSNKPPQTEERTFGTAILKNDESDNADKVVSVIPYNYRHKVNWGVRHGLITGLPLFIYQKNRSVDEYAWGVPYDKEKQDVQQIEYVLAPGTAVNVTLTAKYVDAEIPYTATLVSVFKEGDKMERIIRDTLREAMLRDITPIYSPVYYLHNNSLVPTTTTTTTTTTSTTTEIAKKTTTMETHPIDAPEIQVTDKIKGLDADMKGKGENDVMSDQEDTVGSYTKPENSSGNTSPPSIFLCKAFVLSTILLLILRLT